MPRSEYVVLRLDSNKYFESFFFNKQQNLDHKNSDKNIAEKSLKKDRKQEVKSVNT